MSKEVVKRLSERHMAKTLDNLESLHVPIAIIDLVKLGFRNLRDDLMRTQETTQVYKGTQDARHSSDGSSTV